MKNHSAAKIKKLLMNCVENLRRNAKQFLREPEKNFIRNRKLPFSEIVTSLLSMSGGSIANELMDHFCCKRSTPSTSAFVQQRAKILPEAFEALFHKFNAAVHNNSRHNGYRLLAVDGSDLHIATDPNDTDSYYPSINEHKSYNLLHLNAMYDLCSNTYVDAVIQKSHSANEYKAFIAMTDRFPSDSKTIFIADRGYESYNNMAHIQERGMNFLIRIKDISGNGIVKGLNLPDTDEFDSSVDLFLTRKQTHETKNLARNNSNYKFIPNNVRFDFLPDHTRKSIPVAPFLLHVRLVRFKITDDTYEMIVTNLDRNDFSSEDLKKLYFMRWGIETSFRALKYTIGLLHFHSKKAEYIYQEIFAKLTMYNFTELITSQVIILQKNRKHLYKANFSAAAHVCRSFILKNISPPDVEALILRHICPVRPNRKRPRNIITKNAVSFMYRIA